MDKGLIKPLPTGLRYVPKISLELFKRGFPIVDVVERPVIGPLVQHGIIKCISEDVITYLRVNANGMHQEEKLYVTDFQDEYRKIKWLCPDDVTWCQNYEEESQEAPL